MSAQSEKITAPLYGAENSRHPSKIVTSTNGTAFVRLSVKPYRFWSRKQNRPYPKHLITWRDAAGRQREKVAPALAQKRAKEIANKLEAAQRERSGFLKLCSLRQEMAAEEWFKLLAEHDKTAEEGIADLRQLYQERARANIVRKTCPQIYEELLAARRAEEAGPRWIDDLESRLGRFIKEFTGPLADVRADDLRAWLARLNLSKRSAHNYRTAIVALVAFAKERRYLPKDWDELDAVKPHRIKKGREELYSPREIRSLLYTAEKHFPQHVATLAIMAFAGCRHSELRDEQNALDWSDVHLATAQIHIDEELAKSNTGRRYVPLQPNLVAWLKPYEKARGPVCKVSNLTNALARIAERAQVKWKQNALRNSYISYRCAVTHDVARVAGEAGNSVGEIHKSYRKEIPEAEGQKWWEIWPTREDDLPLFSGRTR